MSRAQNPLEIGNERFKWLAINNIQNVTFILNFQYGFHFPLNKKLFNVAIVCLPLSSFFMCASEYVFAPVLLAYLFVYPNESLLCVCTQLTNGYISLQPMMMPMQQNSPMSQNMMGLTPTSMQVHAHSTLFVFL